MPVDPATASILPFPQPPSSSSTTPESAWLPPVKARVSSHFGAPRQQGPHKGIDLAAPVGTPVIAPQDMLIEAVDNDPSRAGLYVIGATRRPDGSFDGDGYRLTFAHLSQQQVREGQIVRRGETIGLSGETGNANGAHLHFRVEWVDDGILVDDVTAINPMAFYTEQVLLGQAQPQVLGQQNTTAIGKDGRPINIVIAPGGSRISQGGGVTNPDVHTKVGLGG